MIIIPGTVGHQSSVRHTPRPVFATAIILICAIIILCPVAATPEDSSLCEQGLSLVKEANFDSALVCFQEAANRGMSRDSMYYLFAQVFLAKGALDTALALNLSAQPSDSRSVVRVALLRQRLHIYQTLNWNSESKKTEDSLYVSEGGTLRHLKPVLRGFVCAGGYRQTYRYGLDNIGIAQIPNSIAETLTTPSAITSVSATWALPSTLWLQPYVGLSGRVDKSAFVRPVRIDGTLWDSTSLLFGLTGGADFPVLDMRMEYSWQRRRESPGNILSVNTVRVVAARSRQKQLFMTEVSYSGFLSNIPHLQRHVVAIEMMMNQPLIGNLNCTVEAAGSWNLQAPYESDVFFDRFFIRGNTLPAVYYRNDSYTDTIAVTLVGPASAAYTSAVLATAVPDTFHTIIPQQHVSVQPSVLFRTLLGKHSHASLRTSWNLALYTPFATWYTLPESGNYVYVPEKPMRIGRATNGSDWLLPGVAQHEDAALPIVKNTVNRIDNTLHAELSFDHDLSTLGQIRISWYASKTWSTLPADAPALIPDWTIGLNCAITLVSLR